MKIILKNNLGIGKLNVRNPYTTGVRTDLSTNRGTLTICVTTFVLACVLQVASQLTLADELSILMSNYAESLPQQTILFEEFERNTGIKVVVDRNRNTLNMLRPGGAIPDTVTLNYREATTACQENFLIKYDSHTFPQGALANREIFEPWSNGCVALPYANMMVFVTRIDNGLESIVDIFNLDNFEGKLGLWKGPEFNLEWALLADGVQPNEIYSALSTLEGREQAFNKLDKIRDHIVWWNNPAQVPEMLANNEIIMSSAWSNQIGDLDSMFSDLETIWNDRISLFDYVVIPYSSPDPEIAVEFLEFLEGDQSMFQCAGDECQCRGTNVCDSQCCNVVISLKHNSEFWVANGEKLRDRFNAWIAQPQ